MSTFLAAAVAHANALFAAMVWMNGQDCDENPTKGRGHLATQPGPYGDAQRALQAIVDTYGLVAVTWEGEPLDSWSSILEYHLDTGDVPDLRAP